MSYVKEFTYAEHAANTRASKEVLKTYGVTGPQMEVLRYAARPFHEVVQVPGRARIPHDGQVSTHNVRSETLAALRDGGFIQQEYQYSEEQRAELLRKANGLVLLAHEAFAVVDPFGKGDELPVWQEVLVDLGVARSRLKERDNRVTRITEKGRAAVAAFLAALGIKED